MISQPFQNSFKFHPNQIEALNPGQIREALSAQSLIYVSFGTYEWHGEHLPVGLDAIKAHALCLLASERTGGLVCPPMYYGTGGEHGNRYPWTIIHDEAAPIEILVNKTLQRFEDFGIERLVMFTGHFAGEQVQMLIKLAEDWNESGHRMRVLALTDSMLDDPLLPPDHAAIFETSMLGAITPELIAIDRLPPQSTHPAEPPENCWTRERHNESHPLYGIFGQDPRDYDPATAQKLLDQTINWLVTQVEAF